MKFLAVAALAAVFVLAIPAQSVLSQTTPPQISDRIETGSPGDDGRHLLPYDPIQEQRAKAQDLGLAPVVRDVDLSRYDQWPTRVVGELTETANDVPLPMLVPDNDSLLSLARPTHRGNWYAVSMHDDSHGVYITGSVQEFSFRDDRGFPMGRHVDDVPLRVGRAEGILSVTFRVGGASYLVSVECASPFGDVRCTEDEYLLGLVDGLVVVEANQ